MQKGTDSCPETVLRRSSGRYYLQRVRQVAAAHSLAATASRALAGAGCSASVRTGVRRIFRVPQRASKKAYALTVPALIRHWLPRRNRETMRRRKVQSETVEPM